MKGTSETALDKKIRFCFLWSLIFLHLTGCRKTPDDLVLLWKNGKAIGVTLDIKQTESTSIEIRLTGNTSPIIGTIKNDVPTAVFAPLIPFTPGLSYEVWVNGRFSAKFHVPEIDKAQRPSVLAVYPTADTLPENLLKLYVHFSQPMREGVSKKYLHLLNDQDTVRGAFLDLTPELWNEDRTVLTLWLDPGRIKRDLKPNLQLGAPLFASKHYRVAISEEWQDQRLTKLSSAWERAFVTTVRDSLSPRPQSWKIKTPASRTKSPLMVQFGEPMDHELLLETLFVIDHNGELVKGIWTIGKSEMSATFTPSSPWNEGSYRLKVLTKLEDVAGNNLNRPFERIIGEKSTEVEKDFVEIGFSIR